MHYRHMLSLAFATMAFVTTSASAQIITSSFLIHGSVNPNLQTAALVTVNSNTNTYTIQLDNTILGPGGTNGTITSLGFATPFTNAQLGLNGANVSLTTTWTQTNPGHTTPVNWFILEPYNLNAGGNQFEQDVGAGVHASQPNGGNPNNGVEFGEKVTFVFTLPDFEIGDLPSFFSAPNHLSFRWQEVGLNGLPGGGSDANFGTGTPGGPGGPGTPVPEPSTYGMLGAAALLGLIGYRRFRVRQTSA